MKKSILGMLSFSLLAIISCTNPSQDETESMTKTLQSQNKNTTLRRLQQECPKGTIPYVFYQLDQFNFHRPSKSCESGFSLCIQGHWGTECHDHQQNTVETFENKTAYIWADITDDHAVMHFPIALKDVPGYTEEDLSTFYIDNEYEIYKDIILKPGAYKVTETETELIVQVDLL